MAPPLSGVGSRHRWATTPKALTVRCQTDPAVWPYRWPSMTDERREGLTLRSRCRVVPSAVLLPTSEVFVKRALQLLLAAACLLVTLVGASGPADAHTGFDSSDPADGVVVTGEVDSVTIRFTNEAVESGEGFVVLDPVLGVRSPSSIDEPEVGVFVLRFDPSITAGDVGVRWTVQAPDAHPISGAFRFTIEAPATASPPSSDSSPAEEVASPSLDDFLVERSGSYAGE